MRALLPLMLLALWVVAAWARLRGLDGASVGSDALGQYLAAWSWGWGWWPKPPNPEAGAGLWLLAWPLVKLAPSIHGLYAARFILGALVAPLGAWAAWVAIPAPGRRRERVAAAAMAGTWLALDPGLVDTLMVAFRGYGAPELVAGATLLLLRGRRPGMLAVATVVLVLASDQHPLAAGVALGLLGVGPFLIREHGIRGVLVGLGVGSLALLPRVWGVARLVRCGAGWRECVAGVALGSAEPGLSAAGFMLRALHDRFAVEHGWLWVALVVGVLLAVPRHRRLAAFALGATLGVMALGLSIHSLRAYHLRIVAAPLVVLAAVGLARWWPLAVGATVWAAWAWGPVSVPGPHPGGLRDVDALAERLAQVPAPLRVDGAWFGRPEGIEPSAVVLAAVLQGQDPDRFSVQDGALVVVLLNGAPDAVRPVLAQGRGWQAVRFDDLEAARAAMAPRAPSRTGGAYDWMVALHPRQADLQATDW